MDREEIERQTDKQEKNQSNKDYSQIYRKEREI